MGKQQGLVPLASFCTKHLLLRFPFVSFVSSSLLGAHMLRRMAMQKPAMRLTHCLSIVA